MHRDKETAKRKAESGRRAVKMPEKKSDQLVKTICDKKGVTSMKLAAKMNAERSFAGRIAREAAVRTYKRTRCPEFRPELEQRQKRGCGKDKGRNTHFDPTCVEMDPPGVPQLHLYYRGFLGCPQTGG